MYPKYSVLMSVYIRENPQYLRESIKSVLNQSIKPDEFVIVCDGPLTEALDKVIEEYADANEGLFNIVRLPSNVGLGMALNTGVTACSNEIIARMDSDDISYPDRMQKELGLIAKTNADIVSGTVCEFVDSTDNIIAKRMVPGGVDEIIRFARRRNPFNHPAVMYKKSSVLAAGNYQRFDLFEDYYLWIRMLKCGCIGDNLADELVYMRAGKEMYARRGGIKYAGNIIRFRAYLYKSGYSRISDFIVTAGGHALIALLPTAVRKMFYERVLRK